MHTSAATEEKETAMTTAHVLHDLPQTDTAPRRDVLADVIRWRVNQAATPAPPHELFLQLQGPVWDVLSRYYFRLEIDGWDRIPDRTSLLIGVHSGGTLTMDAWTLVHAWQRHFGADRVLHGTATMR